MVCLLHLLAITLCRVSEKLRVVYIWHKSTSIQHLVGIDVSSFYLLYLFWYKEKSMGHYARIKLTNNVSVGWAW